ncbi:MAG: DUF2007 domain-containing protein [Bacteroidales bacterium]
MERDWVRIFESPDEMKVEIARQLLEEHQIDAAIINKRDRVYLIGDVELYVNRGMVIKAKSVIKDLLI